MAPATNHNNHKDPAAPEEGVLLVATGERHRLEAQEAVARIRPHLNGRPLWLACDTPEAVPAGLVDHVLPHPDPRHTYRDKIPPLLPLPFRRTLFLDTDVALLQPVDDLFSLLQTMHVVGCHAPVRWCQWQDPEVPEGFCELNSGVLGLRRGPRVHRMLRRWLSTYDAAGVPFDQASLRSALWHGCREGLRLWVLPPEYNLRTTKPWIAGQGMAVKILHGRIPEAMRGPLERYLNGRTDLFRTSSAFATPLRARILEPEPGSAPPAGAASDLPPTEAAPPLTPCEAGLSRAEASKAVASKAVASKAVVSKAGTVSPEHPAADVEAPASPAASDPQAAESRAGSLPVAAVAPLPASALPAGACRRLFVLGAGRSGTSLLAGLFRHSGLFMGDAGYLSRDANPTGFFEDREVNAINEALLAPLLPSRPQATGDTMGLIHGLDIPGEGQRWLARLPLDTPMQATADLQRRIRSLYARGPSCFKDPRFCYTLAAWRQALPEDDRAQTRYLCVFRDPAVVASSVLQEVHSAAYLANLAISVEQVIAAWIWHYRHVLDHHARSGAWLFLSYEQLFEPEGLDRLAAFTGHAPDRSLPQAQLQRSQPLQAVPAAARDLHRELLARAAVTPSSAPPGRSAAAPTPLSPAAAPVPADRPDGPSPSTPETPMVAAIAATATAATATATAATATAATAPSSGFAVAAAADGGPLRHGSGAASRPIADPGRSGATSASGPESPPKVFGIGLNKTGTTTLGTCLQILGFRHSSFDLSLLEQAACGDLEPLLQTVSAFDSFEDWPYPLLFEQLDQHFPGSRFILSRRSSPERWLDSLCAHALRTDPLIGSRCRSLTYGLPFPQLDPELHLQHYHRHLERVRAHFRDRPGALLEVCWEEEARWEPLCAFLDRPVPSVPFPHANAAHPPDPDHLRRNTALIAWHRRLRGASLV